MNDHWIQEKVKHFNHTKLPVMGVEAGVRGRVPQSRNQQVHTFLRTENISISFFLTRIQI